MNILLTSAGRRSYMVDFFKAALNGNGLVHASNSVFSPALAAADRWVVTPLIYDATYITFLQDYCAKNLINAIVPLFDIDLPVLAKARDEFSRNGVAIVVSDYEVTQICNDKWKTYNFLTVHNIDTPKSFIDLKCTQEALEQGVLAFPLIIKPRWGMGSKGVYTADNEKELAILYAKLEKEIFTTYLSYESAQDRDHCIIIQERLSGIEYGLDIVNDLTGEHAATFVHRKIAQWNGETDVAVAEDVPALTQQGKKISLALRHRANLDVDCFLVEGTPYILEMNCRFGGIYPFSHLAGANVPSAIVSWLKDEIPDPIYLRIQDKARGMKGITVIRQKQTDG